MRRMRSTIVILLIFVISLVNSFQTLPTKATHEKLLIQWPWKLNKRDYHCPGSEEGEGTEVAISVQQLKRKPHTRVKRQLYGYGLGYPSGYVYGNPYTFATYRGLGLNGLYGTGLYGNGLYGNGLYGGGLYGGGLYGGYGLGLGLLGLPYGGLYGR